MFDKEVEEREHAWIDHENGFILEGIKEKVTNWDLDDKILDEISKEAIE